MVVQKLTNVNRGTVVPEPGGPGGPLAPPIFVRTVNPIRTREGRLSPPITTGPPMFFTSRHHPLLQSFAGNSGEVCIMPNASLLICWLADLFWRLNFCTIESLSVSVSLFNKKNELLITKAKFNTKPKNLQIGYVHIEISTITMIKRSLLLKKR